MSHTLESNTSIIPSNFQSMTEAETCQILIRTDCVGNTMLQIRRR
jgi:hypothetical protein